MNRSFLVIRDFDQFSRILAEKKYQVINLPMIQTLPVEDFASFDAKLNNLESFDGLFLTSPKAAEIFLDRAAALNRQFGGKVYILGNRTNSLFENTSFETVFRESANTVEELIASLKSGEVAGKKFLLVRGDKRLLAIPELVDI